MPTEDEIEAAARAIHQHEPYSWCAGIPWDELDAGCDSAPGQYRNAARAALEAAEPLRNPPATGWELDCRDGA